MTVNRLSRLLIELCWIHCVSAVLYSEYILAPKSKTLLPKSVYSLNGPVAKAHRLLSGDAATFTGVNTSVTFDFGKEIGGNINFNVDSFDGSSHSLAFTFTESSQWISPEFCDSVLGSTGRDPPMAFNITSKGYHASEKNVFRGGFRYLTVVSNSTGTIAISNLTVNFNAEPATPNPSAYTGYFHCDSEKLNRVWYAGAYTNQMCIIDPTQGDSLKKGFLADKVISNGTSVLVDGPKRSRMVWPGDIVVSAPSLYVSTGNYDAVRNALDSLLILQQSNGQLPYAGTPYQQGHSSETFLWSFTYHLYTLIVVYDYYIFTGDLDYIKEVWDQFKLALDYSISTIDSTGMALVTSGLGIYLANEVHDDTVVAEWAASRTSIQTAIIPFLWNSAAGLFRDKDTSSVTPQDGNSWAVISGLVNSTIASVISNSLAARWIRPYGAPAPEGGTTIAPFASGFELRAHYLAGNASRAVDLMSFMWADFMLDDPRMTNSTFLEGYSTDGSIRWAPYTTADSKISYAHGWSTTPTSALTNLAAGIRLTGPAGRSWIMQPRLGGLRNITAGFSTKLGAFTASYTQGGQMGEFETPAGTEGSFIFSLGPSYSKLQLKGPEGTLTSLNSSNDAMIASLPGGKYYVRFT
ncbi:hypothetical protein PFICI_08641 [Pestalotiopsis fici W106-1]|uniref:Alpha-L-rhamnosidase six-hairpin glycosidase domain-containing protein n=1 Tax=Pestalotiopsis fici (strain W106-1 / CGMCC3.15140) TaxID=1229662 RepID=W3WY50_PESFW|nr:uncharacterized protein PFICI_08641 [Pestalotiopsis fici W106-1]ETS78788.1 hypothetical protein PFICI_08641 [Pestalotiopsis fici W106-1]